jgi:hypothetical protein
MNQVTVPAGSHEGAIDYLYGANQTSNDKALALSNALDGYSAMAGDDDGGRAFAAQYDDAAGGLLQGCITLSNSLGAMANLLNANLVNHDGADFGARVMPSAVGSDDDGDPDPTHYSISLSAPDPPSAAGGNGSPPTGWGALESHLQGFLWPNADTGKLRKAASTWRTYAGDFWSVSGEVQAAKGEISQVHSAEVPLILGACDELTQHCNDLHEAMTDVGNACDEYAQQVDDHHQMIIDTVEEMIGWSILDQAAGAVLSFFSFGLAEGGAQAIEAGLLARCAARVIEILRALKTIAFGLVSRLVKAAGKAVEISSKLAKFLKAERLAARLHKAAMAITLQGKKLAGLIDVPVVANAKLKNYVDQFYKGAKSADRTGTGTTADAVRAELAGMDAIKGRNHIQKARELVSGLTKWIRRNPDADPGDIAAAQHMIDDLQAALAGH